MARFSAAATLPQFPQCLTYSSCRNDLALWSDHFMESNPFWGPFTKMQQKYEDNQPLGSACCLYLTGKPWPLQSVTMLLCLKQNLTVQGLALSSPYSGGQAGCSSSGILTPIRLLTIHRTACLLYFPHQPPWAGVPPFPSLKLNSQARGDRR